MKASGFCFEVTARDGAARSGRLATPHGVVETPAFMCVATYGAVRGVSMPVLEGLGAQILLANTYHLHERPGEDTIAGLGGLHGFSGFGGPWLSDSGGYQVTSLADRMQLDEDGITFSSPLDGTRRSLTPESAIAIQEKLGADIAMVLDVCHRPRPDAKESESRRMREAMEQTLRWARRSAAARSRPDQAVFGIVQGGLSAELRRTSAAGTVDVGFDGYAHGGLGLGEPRSQRGELIEAAQAALPEERPRYLMGLGHPIDLVDAVAAGVDLFDCVVPTRNGRHGVLFTSRGRLQAKSARFRDDPLPPDPDCDCATCSRVSRGYLRHLLSIGESLGAQLASVHNLRFTLRLLERARAAIAAGTFAALRREVAALEDARV
jgi:queuine tRNA-ribosyltransferase